jgi:hypothetical protein
MQPMADCSLDRLFVLDEDHNIGGINYIPGGRVRKRAGNLSKTLFSIMDHKDGLIIPRRKNPLLE